MKGNKDGVASDKTRRVSDCLSFVPPSLPPSLSLYIIKLTRYALCLFFTSQHHSPPRVMRRQGQTIETRSYCNISNQKQGLTIVFIGSILKRRDVSRYRHEAQTSPRSSKIHKCCPKYHIYPFIIFLDLTCIS